MIHAPSPELLTPAIASGQPEVGHTDPLAIIPAQDVLGLKIAVVHAEAMTPGYSVHKLAEHLLDQLVVTQVRPVVEDLGEEVAGGCVIHDDVGVLSGGVDDSAMESDDIRVGGDNRVQVGLSHMKLALASECRSGGSSGC